MPAGWLVNGYLNRRLTVKAGSQVKVHMKWIFSLHNFTFQYVNKSIVNAKVLLSKNLVMFLALKTTYFFVKKWSGGWDDIYCSISSCDVVLWTELITKKGFWGKTTCQAILNWVLSLSLQMTTRILMLCIANTRRIVLLSLSLAHNNTSSGHFGRAIRGPFLGVKSHNFQAL